MLIQQWLIVEETAHGVNNRRSLSALQQYADHGESYGEDVNDDHDCIG